MTYKDLLALQVAAANGALAFGYPLTELRANTSIIGELTCAIETEGTVASKSNQRGWDVDKPCGAKVSVKTRTTRGPTMKVRASTAHLADEQHIYFAYQIDCRIGIKLVQVASREEVLASPRKLDSGSEYYFVRMTPGFWK